MGRSRLSFFSLIVASFFVALSGASVFRGEIIAPQAVDAIPATSTRTAVVTAEPAVSIQGEAQAQALTEPQVLSEAAAIAEERAQPERLASEQPKAPSLSHADRADASPLNGRFELSAEPSTEAAPHAPHTVDSLPSRERPAPAGPPPVHPPRDPRPSAYRPHPGLIERPVTLPTRAERPRPMRTMLSPAERELLAHLIFAEASTEPYEGKVAVAAVVLNRLEHPQFPNTIEGIVFEPRAFEPVRNGRLWRGTSELSYRALDDALRGWDPTNGALYFYNPRLTSPNNWIRSRQVIHVIGQHYFAI